MIQAVTFFGICENMALSKDCWCLSCHHLVIHLMAHLFGGGHFALDQFFSVDGGHPLGATSAAIYSNFPPFWPGKRKQKKKDEITKYLPFLLGACLRFCFFRLGFFQWIFSCGQTSRDSTKDPLSTHFGCLGNPKKNNNFLTLND